jgi:hypothetical protein
MADGNAQSKWALFMEKVPIVVGLVTAGVALAGLGFVPGWIEGRNQFWEGLAKTIPQGTGNARLLLPRMIGVEFFLVAGLAFALLAVVGRVMAAFDKERGPKIVAAADFAALFALVSLVTAVLSVIVACW